MMSGARAEVSRMKTDESPEGTEPILAPDGERTSVVLAPPTEPAMSVTDDEEEPTRVEVNETAIRSGVTLEEDPLPGLGAPGPWPSAPILPAPRTSPWPRVNVVPATGA